MNFQGKKNKKRKHAQVPMRLNILFIAIFLIFSLLIVQLGIVQIINGEEASRQVSQTENTPSEKAVPRGKMLDKNHRLIVDNDPKKAITYTPPKNGDSAQDRLKLATKLAGFITMIKDQEELEDTIRERDQKEYWYLKNRDKIEERLTEEQKEELEPSERYQEELELITESDLAKIDWTPELYNILAIKKELDAAYELSTHTIVNEGLTDKEFATVAENLHELSGIDAVIDWEREPQFGDTLSSFIGNVTSSDEGIPSENSQYYLSNGYTRNDRVGTSGLEEQYEHVLRGRKEKVQYETDAYGTVINSDIVVEGERGKDLVLTVDMELQKELDKIVEDELKKAINHPVNNNGYLEDALLAMMNPQTGEIIGLSGFRYDREKKEYVNNAYRTVYDAHVPGSSIKGATVLAGYQSGVIDIGSYLSEQPIKIGDTVKSSYSNFGSSLNDVQALEKSSNVYMMRIAIAMSGANYRYGDSLRNFNYDSFDELRYYYDQFGLGVQTGIDLPFEAIGVKGTNQTEAGKYLDLSFGQYDTYTTLQLVQYASTIANGGYRMRPHFVKEIREPGGENGSPGKIIQSIQPEIMNRVEMDDKYISRVQEGFRRVYTTGTASGRWSGFPYEMAGKTGTAQNPQFKDGKKVADTHNLTLVGYSPVENPEVAFAVVVPKNGTGSQYPVHHEIGKRAVKAYYDHKNGNDDEEEDDDE
ncbi:penicillin-binding protein 2 [Gracilibacillus sp. S3-1-1]|uniref:Penicillin-binding protein 2 n=1 Tax=Gracilibacillus pellucidus TaxID=3095368 RepID=A0ACC6MA02_9BACI|nr:penicillin-binding protein 2 [Gracilibacillus sp. S3-1-1]MDX8047696.1 penicillin-binding protein 2 [Gracilibacillus sp. S3-1-1]